MLLAIVVGVVAGVLGMVLGALLGIALRERREKGKLAAAEADAARIIAEAQTREKELLLEAKEEAIRIRAQAEAEAKERRQEVLRLEERVLQKEENLDRKAEALERRDRAVAEREQHLEEARAKLEDLQRQRVAEIERVAHLTTQEARGILLAEIEGEVREEANRIVREMESRAREDGAMRAREILTATVQRMSAEAVSESTVTVVPIPSEEMKGRIIGREGRNIRALEHATGIDLIIDDTPDAVMLSGFDGVRREVARLALTRLISDGRIHPTRIEEVVEKCRAEIENEIKLAGEEAALKANCPGLHPEIVRTLGRLKYRTSYGQNQLMHAVESAHIAAMLARELGADVNVARRGALLHDLGKAIDREVEGTHALLGADLARRFGVQEAVAHCIEAHHEEVQPSTIEAIIVQVADSISGGRPGARMESLESYIKRLEALETVATSFPGVEKAFAIQAGREVRIIVKPEEIDDLGSMRLARDVSKKIEETMEYPGQIKVTVVRETRATEYAR
ncbi:MAG TPA: ribonuclease Y [Dehalococcoidia bacterium]|nr:ribonuclease Y [Dehalococcoidia bacterium]